MREATTTIVSHTVRHLANQLLSVIVYAAPEMRMVPIYPHYAQPLPQPAMIYRQPPIYYNRLLHRRDKPCCNDICCDRCCDECCG